jgi:hypothetical protein
LERIRCALSFKATNLRQQTFVQVTDAYWKHFDTFDVSKSKTGQKHFCQQSCCIRPKKKKNV